MKIIGTHFGLWDCLTRGFLYCIVRIEYHLEQTASIDLSNWVSVGTTAI